MSNKLNKLRKGCKDVFNAFLVELARYAGIFEFPVIKPTYDIPNKLVAFSKCISSNNYDAWVHFYEDDYLFERLWRSPKKYLEVLKRYNGVILPDFSLYRDMPFVMQLWNIYRSRAIGCWLQTNGIKVIPNLRYGDASKTYEMALDPVKYAEAVVKKYNINLKGSGQVVKIVFNPKLGMGQFGRTRKDAPNVIEIGPSALYSEKQLANTIAHELNHVRSFLRGGKAPEETAYPAGDALQSYIEGGR